MLRHSAGIDYTLTTMRHTIRGLLIKNRKILLVTGHAADFYWTPGGGVEGNETHEQTLRREIKEELGVSVLSLSPHSSYTYNNQLVDNYLITITGDISPGNEITSTAWYDSSTDIKTSEGFRTTVLPQLLRENLID